MAQFRTPHPTYAPAPASAPVVPLTAAQRRGGGLSSVPNHVPPSPGAAQVGADAEAFAPRERAPGPHAPATLVALLDSLTSEQRLVDELTATMRRQRAAVGADDLQAVDDSVFATHRLLATLGQARQRRKAVNRLLCGHEEIPLRLLDEVVGVQMTDDLRDAREGLQESAEALAHEVAINRRVLREALANGEQLVHAFTGSPAESRAGYGPNAAPVAAAGGFLVNRTA